MTRRMLILCAAVVALSVIAVLLLFHVIPQGTYTPAAPVLAPHTPFTYSFKVDGALEEAGSAAETTSPYWWLNSGGRLLIRDDTGATITGRLSPLDRWRLRYSATNPVDTDDGYHPQNVFRLVSRSEWQSPRIEASFLITADTMSESPNRNESNGILLMSRYEDENTLYYAGLRVDGHAVIKKKYHGTYYTMAEKSIFPGSYSRIENPNLLPHNTWFTLRSETTTTKDGVLISLFMRDGTEGSWVPLLSVLDDGTTYGGTPVITGSYPIGIRTDFMDVQFQTIHIEELPWVKAS